METRSTSKKGEKRKERQIFLHELYVVKTYTTTAREPSIHPFTEIPVLNDYPLHFSKCTHDVIQVDQKYAACI